MLKKKKSFGVRSSRTGKVTALWMVSASQAFFQTFCSHLECSHTSLRHAWPVTFEFWTETFASPWWVNKLSVGSAAEEHVGLAWIPPAVWVQPVFFTALVFCLFLCEMCSCSYSPLYRTLTQNSSESSRGIIFFNLQNSTMGYLQFCYYLHM